MMGFKILKYVFSLIFLNSLFPIPSLFFESLNFWLVFIIIWSVVQVYSQYIHSCVLLPHWPYLDFCLTFFTGTVICRVFCDLKVEYLWTTTCHNKRGSSDISYIWKEFFFMFYYILCNLWFWQNIFCANVFCVQIYYVVN